MEAQLTPREEEIKQMLDRRLSAREIAAVLGISEWTVRYHMRLIHQRQDAAKRREWEG